MRRSCYLPYSGEESKHNEHCNIDGTSLQGTGQQHNDTRLVHSVSDKTAFRHHHGGLTTATAHLRPSLSEMGPSMKADRNPPT